MSNSDNQAFRGSRHAVRTSLQSKVVLWTFLLIVVPTVIYTFWIHRRVRDALIAHHRRNVATLAQTFSAALSNRMSAGTLDRNRLISTLERDGRLAFVVVERSDGRPLLHRAADPEALHAYQQRQQPRHQLGAAATNRPILFGADSSLVVCRTPIWNPPLGQELDRQGSARTPGRKLEGFVTVALHEPDLAITLEALQDDQIAAASVIFLVSLILVSWVVRRWMKPLGALIAAASRLSAGATPMPVTIQTHDEIGVLAATFNDMVNHLTAAQQQMAAGHEDLERTIERRTADLALANGRLETQMKDHDEFLRAVTHDLAAPMRNINGMITMLMRSGKDQFDDNARHKLERISANAKIQDDLIADLLELSRLRSRTAKREQVDVHELVEQLCQGMAYDLEQSGITIDIVGTLPLIVADRTRIRQIFQNLMDNAVKYMGDSAQRRITVSHTEHKRSLQFSVCDTGPGIDPSDQPHVFEVFRRAYHGDQNAPDSPGGRGVGLASVKAIVELNGGRIWLESELGKGATFHFTLDRQIVDAMYDEVLT